MPSDNPDTQRKNDVILREAQKRFAEDVIEQLRRQEVIRERFGGK